MKLLANLTFLMSGLMASPFIGLPEKNSQPADFEDFDAIDLLNVCAYASMSVSEYQLQSLLFTTHVATLNS